MIENQKIREIVFQCIDEINLQMIDTHRLDNSDNEVIIGEGGKLDSLGIINFLILIEDKLREVSNVELDLVELENLSEEESRIKTVGALIQWIGDRV